MATFYWNSLLFAGHMVADRPIYCFPGFLDAFHGINPDIWGFQKMFAKSMDGEILSANFINFNINASNILLFFSVYF